MTGTPKEPVAEGDIPRPPVTASGLQLVSASAGSGKTYRLTEEVTRALDPGSATCIEVESLVAVTYTIKAQAELTSRLRRELVKQGAFDRAEQLPLAYLGTVHSVCLRLVKEFAIDAGLSPSLDGMPAEAARLLLQEVLEFRLPSELWDRIEASAAALEIEWDARVFRHDWVTPVEQIMTLARSNRIEPHELPAMAARSLASYCALFPPPVPDGKALESELAQALVVAIETVSLVADGQQNTAKYLALARESASKLATGHLPWSSWQKLAALAPGKRAVPLVQEVQRIAADYLQHPAFHAQISEFTQSCFEAARLGLQVFSRWKAERGLVDYVDMIDSALSVVEAPEVARELSQRLSLLVVDEFQDTSPIQLALFMRLHGLCKRSLWVGDRKQCIFEYAGADPVLMEATAKWARQRGGERELLKTNYRSRPELVHAVSSLFAAAFSAHDHSPEEVITDPDRPELEELSALPPVGVWWLTGKSDCAPLAEGVARLLREPAATPVLDPVTESVRPVRPSDIAILVYSNADAENVARELKALGIASVLPRTGLVRTPEGTLVSAALRLLVDPADRLAAAEIDALTGFEGQSHEQWLTERIRAYHAYKRANAVRGDVAEPEVDGIDNLPSEPSTEPHSRPLGEAVRTLQALRAELGVLAPTEVLDRVLRVLALARLTQRWPAPEQRLANLEALRALGVAYEERCTYLREAASLAGLTRYFEDTQLQIRQRDEERATDEQHVGNPEQAVIISTYHKAKGLEWPVVVLGSLGRDRKRHAFEVAPESESAEFDPERPLQGRSIRYWPWPLGKLENAPLADRAAASAVGRAVVARDVQERVRLLYVGFTRARDHLVLAVRLGAKGKANATWLNELADGAGPLLDLPASTITEGEPALSIRGLDEVRRVRARVWELEKEAENTPFTMNSSSRVWFARGAPAASNALPYLITPSSKATTGLEPRPAHIVAVQRFGKRMPFTSPGSHGWDHVGTTLHAFLAADDVQLEEGHRLALARGILSRAGLAASFEAEALVSASDALSDFLTERWPGAVWRREVPIVAAIGSEHGTRLIKGTIDLLLETKAGFVIIDHKSFPGRADAWTEQALAYAQQLFTYERAINVAGGIVLSRLIHFTIGGGIVELAQAP